MNAEAEWVFEIYDSCKSLCRRIDFSENISRQLASKPKGAYVAQVFSLFDNVISKSRAFNSANPQGQSAPLDQGFDLSDISNAQIRIYVLSTILAAGLAGSIKKRCQ